MKYVMALGVLLLLARPAYAYVDPGTGMLAIQGLIAALAWILSLVTHPFRKIKGLIQRLWKKPNA
jgi:hypothetical protein